MAVMGEVAEREMYIEWTVSDFFSLPDKVDELYISPLFSFDGARWRLALYPSGQQEEKTEGFIDVGLVRESSGPPIQLNFTLGLKTSNNEIAEETHHVHNFEKQFDNFGWIRFLKRSTLLKRKAKLAPSGRLTCICWLKHPESVDAASGNSTSEPVVKSKLIEDLKQLLQNQDNCDVVLRVKGRDFPAHRSILTARSSVFASAFRNDMKEKATGVVDIEDCDPSTFSDFLHFLYCEDVECLSDENVSSLFIAADKYDVSDLREMCIEFMKENLSADLFCDTCRKIDLRILRLKFYVLTLALRHSEMELVRLATDFFIANADKIIVTVAWQTFVAENPTQGNELFIKYVSSVKH